MDAPFLIAGGAGYFKTGQYVNYAKDAKGEFTVSKFVDISNVVTYKV